MELLHTGDIVLQDVFFFFYLLMSRTSLEKEQSLVNTLCLERDSCTACTVLKKIHNCIVGEILFYEILYTGKSAFTKQHTNLHINPGCLFHSVMPYEKKIILSTV